MATTTTAKPQQQSYKERQQANKALALQVNPPRLPYPAAEAAEYKCSAGMWRGLIDSTWPSAKTVDGVLLALNWCRQRRLDPIKKPCHVVSIWSSSLNREVESVWPSIAEVRITAHRTAQYAGCDETLFGPEITTVFEGDVDEWRDNNKTTQRKKITMRHPEWAQVTVYRLAGGEPRKFVGPKVYFLAAYGCIGKTDLPNEKWTEPGAQMLDKCAEAAALRKAFPEEIGNEHVAEEMEGRKFVDFGGGMSVASPDPANAKGRPARTDFGDGQAGARDVQGDGTVDDPDGGAGGEDTTEEAAPEGHVLIDGTGETLTQGLTDAAFANGVSALFKGIREPGLLTQAFRNNIATIKQIGGETHRRLVAEYDALLDSLKRGATNGNKAADKAPAAEKAAPADKAPAPGGALDLYDARGKVAAASLDDHAFAIELSKLFTAAELQIDLEAIYRANSNTVRDLPDAIRETILQSYDLAVSALRNNVRGG